MSQASNRVALGAAIALAATSVTAQETDAPVAPDIQSQYTLVSADPENFSATIEVNVNGGDNYQRALGCSELSSQQERIEQDVIQSAATFIAFGTNDQRYQESQLQLGFGHTTLGDVYKYASDNTIDRNEEHGGLTYAAGLGADRGILINAQIAAGCFTPEGLSDRGLPAPRP